MKFWNFKETGNGERELRLDGAISDETWFEDEITPQKFRAELNAGKGDIVVWINSPGGDVFAATEIYNALKEYSGRVTVKIDSLAGSAASMVAMAGDLVEISPTGQMFLHNPETAAIGNTTEFTAAIKCLEQVKEGLITAYEFKTKLPRERISKLMDDETWLNAKKAVELKFADKIMYAESKLQPPTAQLFSQRRVTDSLTTAFRAKKRIEEEPEQRRVAVSRLSGILDEIAEYKPDEWGKSLNECSELTGTNISYTKNQQQKSGLRRGKNNA